MKVLITTLNSKYSHVNIAGYYLKHCIEDLCQVTITHYTINDNLDHILEDIHKNDCDLVCFGCYIWNIEQTLKIAKNLKNISPNTLIALGGPEVSYNASEILSNHPYISSIMCGEGENSIRALVQDILNQDLQKIYTLPVSCTQIPRIAKDIVQNYDNRVVYFETSRGCPYRCSYCLSCIDKNIKYFDIEQVKEDLLLLLDKNVTQIRFLDRTFNSDRKRALDLWKFLLKHRKNTTFHFEICVNLIDVETLEFLKTVPKDIIQLEIGIQSTNPKTLAAIQRAYHFEKEKEILKTLVSYGNIKLHTDLIIGLPFENLNSFKQSFNDLYSLHTSEMQLGFLKFLKGSDIYDKKDEYGYIFNSFPPFEVYQNNDLSYGDICYLKKLEEIFELYYNSHFFSYTITYLETCYDNAYELFEDITNYFISKHLFDKKISIETCFESLIEKYQTWSSFSDIQQTLTYDYFLKFKGTRDWFYSALSPEETKTYLYQFLEKNRNLLFEGKTNSDIYKQYRFCILDIDLSSMQEKKNTIYFTKK